MQSADLDGYRAGLGYEGRPVPAYQTFGMRIVEVGGGRAVVRLAVAPPLLGTDGRLLAGALAVIADTACGTAVAVAGPGGPPMLTAQLRLEVVRPLPVAPGWLTADGQADFAGDDSGLARGELVDAAGELVAVTSLRAINPQRSLASPPASPPTSPPTSAQMDSTHSPSAADPTSSAIVSGANPPAAVPPPAGALSALLGVVSRTRKRGESELTLRPGLQVANSFGAVHGGVLGLIAHIVAADAQATVLVPGERLVPLDLAVNYLRGVPAGGEPVTAAATVAYRGRQFVVAEGELRNSDGRGAIRFSCGAQIRRSG
ncbi:PaaI family thioesterase [Frankia sp. Cr1]|uniref:PaaI family thioesterase n=1 Tax=Frankia sp. Cr1 TaxID=3073931 RepID=UPI002AD324D0|nr:PaaI family thioesterase [Frankia sp. Cr1]